MRAHHAAADIQENLRGDADTFIVVERYVGYRRIAAQAAPDTVIQMPLAA